MKKRATYKELFCMLCLESMAEHNYSWKKRGCEYIKSLDYQGKRTLNNFILPKNMYTDCLRKFPRLKKLYMEGTLISDKIKQHKTTLRLAKYNYKKFFKEVIKTIKL